MSNSNFILGGGVTGLAAGISSGCEIFEAKKNPGGICSSYYMRAGTTLRLYEKPADEEIYRFELGGGHWIFGGDPSIIRFIKDLTVVKSITRHSGIWFNKSKQYVPYPIQNHLNHLPQKTTEKVLIELATKSSYTSYDTMANWLKGNFGPTLCRLFFNPFHEFYTAGLYKNISPQDIYKSPININRSIRGVFQNVNTLSYNSTYLYPQKGLDELVKQMTSKCQIHYEKTVTEIKPDRKEIFFSDGSKKNYNRIISTIPLNKMMQIANLSVNEKPAPYTSVLVLNIGAKAGINIPKDHWLYHPKTNNGFHRTGIYSNVDGSFLPLSTRKEKSHISLYIEKSFIGGTKKPFGTQLEKYCLGVIDELQSWNFIEEVEVFDPTWIDVAYTWSFPKSTWVQKSITLLEKKDIYMVGRYGRWIFQGIADSIKDGLVAGQIIK